MEFENIHQSIDSILTFIDTDHSDEEFVPHLMGKLWNIKTMLTDIDRDYKLTKDFLLSVQDERDSLLKTLSIEGKKTRESTEIEEYDHCSVWNMCDSPIKDLEATIERLNRIEGFNLNEQLAKENILLKFALKKVKINSEKIASFSSEIHKEADTD